MIDPDSRSVDGQEERWSYRPASARLRRVVDALLRKREFASAGYGVAVMAPMVLPGSFPTQTIGDFGSPRKSKSPVLMVPTLK